MLLLILLFAILLRPLILTPIYITLILVFVLITALYPIVLGFVCLDLRTVVVESRFEQAVEAALEQVAERIVL
jgi:hypothetical protein